MQYYENREKDYYEVAQGQRNGYGQSQSHEGYGQKQSRPVYGLSPTMNHRSHGGFLDGLFKGQTGLRGQSGVGTFLGQRKTQDANKGHGHGKLLGQHQKKTHETNKGLNGLGMFINNGEKKHRRQSEHKKKSKDGHGSGDESGSSSGSDSD
ncbi:hypothetical protein CARUB_v10021104mg [Capsella rubella]|uniref:Uncharacterized protein n=1 Tax=Capsella rubella TaxID=81985 RepID=R0I0Y1_9BRAS|nr:filaggrin-2 [Capsella rubella]EOA35864.1 hypothetical protein CARUB_v10021104mg [Capsella rubella]